jgi:hypothetical protein
MVMAGQPIAGTGSWLKVIWSPVSASMRPRVS